VPATTAVIDPNVLISALIRRDGGNPASVVRSIDTGVLVPILSPILVTQLDEAAARPKFRRYFSLVDAWTLRGLLEAQGQWHADPPAGPRLTRDPNDDYLVRLYRSSGAEWLLSGDRDLLEAQLSDVEALSPQQAVVKLMNRWT